VLWYGVNLVLSGQLTSGSLLVFLLYLGKMYKPMRDLSKMTDTMSKAGVGYERIREVIETEDTVRNLPGAKKLLTFAARLNSITSISRTKIITARSTTSIFTLNPDS
jgi:subfamily B ATP-binding cassette protein MsbA